jgi:hypothetical protein
VKWADVGDHGASLHTVLKACLGAAAREKLLARTPVDDVEMTPAAGKFDHEVLDDAYLARLVAGFKDSSLYPMVALSAIAGPRLRETIANTP